jgi:hypothetical protein
MLNVPRLKCAQPQRARQDDMFRLAAVERLGDLAADALLSGDRETNVDGTALMAPNPGADWTVAAHGGMARAACPVHGGSYPPGCHGWQRHTRPIPFQLPRAGPYLRTASMKYSLQLGVKRQTAGKIGRRQIW